MTTSTTRFTRQAAVLGSLLILGLPAAPARATAAEEGPREVMTQTMDAAFRVLKDPALAGKAQRGQRIDALRAIADRTFDWAEMARSSLGVKWRSLDAGQRARFVEVFKDVLAAQYMDDIDRFQGTETVSVVAVVREDPDSVVRTILITSSRERVPIDYRMRTVDGRWRVVDLSIEGVSLVNHFRKTFAAALANASIEDLITRLRRQLPAAASPAR
jgi:phospholipid transport system substrate-binding protein